MSDEVERLRARLSYSSLNHKSQWVSQSETIVKKDDLRAVLDALAASDSGRLREALESLRALNQGVYDNDSLTPRQRNFAKLCIEKIDEALKVQQ